MFEHIFKSIDDILRKEAGCTTELDYTEQSSWLLFLKYLDDLEEERAVEADLHIFKSIDDILRKEAGCTTELDYTEQSSWLLFLKYLDDLEEERAVEAELQGKKYTYILDKPHR